MAASHCPVCTEAFTGSVRKPIACPMCHDPVCLKCCKAYLEYKPQPCCAICNGAWDKTFSDAVFPKNYRNNELKRKREHILFETEKTLLAHTQPYAQFEMTRRAVAARLVELRKQRMRLHTNLRREKAAGRTEVIKKRKAELREEIGRVDGELNGLTYQHYRLTMEVTREAVAPIGQAAEPAALAPVQEPEVEQRQFIKRCPVNTCTGFLSTQYKCGMCDVRVCTKCGDLKEEGGHVCNPDSIATMQLLAKDTKPCPQCAAPIHKIDGCDQMWCTSCHTAFSWRTGLVDTGNTHNPHYFEFLRQNGGGVGLQPCGGGGDCAGLPYLMYPRMVIGNVTITRAHRCLSHVTNVTMRMLRGNLTQGNRDLRIKFLLKDIDEDKMKKLLQQRDKKKDKHTDMSNIMETVLQAGANAIRAMTEIREEDALRVAIAQAVEQLERLRVYCNESFDAVALRYDCKKYNISEDWVINDNIMTAAV